MFWCLCKSACLFWLSLKWVYSSNSIGLKIRLNSIGLKNEWESLVKALCAGRLADSIWGGEKNYPGESWIFWWSLCLWEKETLRIQRSSIPHPLRGCMRAEKMELSCGSFQRRTYSSAVVGLLCTLYPKQSLCFTTPLSSLFIIEMNSCVAMKFPAPRPPPSPIPPIASAVKQLAGMVIFPTFRLSQRKTVHCNAGTGQLWSQKDKPTYC